MEGNNSCDNREQRECSKCNEVENRDIPKLTGPSFTLGDPTSDEKINSSDALAVLQHSVGQITLTGDNFKAGDVTKDSIINSSDALMILQYSVGLIDKF